MSDKTLKYQFLERRVRGQACVDIFVLPLPVPRYSFKLGSARVIYGDDEQGEVDIIPYLNSFSYKDAADLLTEVGAEFDRLRDEAKEAAASVISTRLSGKVEVVRKRRPEQT